jgi:hypothetical protein
MQIGNIYRTDACNLWADSHCGKSLDDFVRSRSQDSLRGFVRYDELVILLEIHETNARVITQRGEVGWICDAIGSSKWMARLREL